jgi:hypothetical protein
MASMGLRGFFALHSSKQSAEYPNRCAARP